MIKKISASIIFICICTLVLSMENTAVKTVIRSQGDDAIYDIHISDSGTFAVEEADMPRSVRRVSVQSYWNTFLDINNIFTKEIINRIEATLRESFGLCGNNKITKESIPEGASVFGYASPASANNISLSPSKTYAIVKTALGPYFLLNLTSFKLENICIESGAHVLWKGDEIVAISFNTEGVKAYGYGSNAIFVYNIMTKKSYYKEYGDKRVEDISWINDEGNLLVLLSTKQTSFNPFNLLLDAIGHPPTYRKFELILINSKLDNEISSIQLGGKVPNANGYINKEINGDSLNYP